MIIFTASEQLYADSVLSKIDPMKSYFKYRLYRNNCIKRSYNGGKVYIKDLRVIKNMPIENMLLIDNSLLSFAYNLDNGVPILPYYHNKNDTEMTNLKNYLLKLAKRSNIVSDNAEVFKFKSLLEQMLIASPDQSIREIDKNIKIDLLEHIKRENMNSHQDENYPKESKSVKQFSIIENLDNEKVNKLDKQEEKEKTRSSTQVTQTTRKKSKIQTQLIEVMQSVKNFK